MNGLDILVQKETILYKQSDQLLFDQLLWKRLKVGVQFGNVRVASEAGNIVRVIRTSIVNTERVPNRGRAMAEAFEQAAVLVGREAGATSVKMSVETVVNPRWLEQLRVMGYQMEQIITYSKTGAFQSLSNVWTKIITL